MEQKFKVILGYRVNSRLVWDIHQEKYKLKNIKNIFYVSEITTGCWPRRLRHEQRAGILSWTQPSQEYLQALDGKEMLEGHALITRGQWFNQSCLYHMKSPSITKQTPKWQGSESLTWWKHRGAGRVVRLRGKENLTCFPTHLAVYISSIWEFLKLYP